MRRIVFFIFAALIIQGAVAQVLQPATWSYDVSARDVKVGDEVELIFIAQDDFFNSLGKLGPLYVVAFLNNIGNYIN